MARVFVNDSTLTDIADAIREKNGTEEMYKPSQMAGAVRGIQSGGEEWLQYGTNLRSMFESVAFHENTELFIYLPNFGGTSVEQNLYRAFHGATGLKSIKLKCDNVVSRAAQMCFAQNKTVEVIDFSEFPVSFTSCSQMFNYCTSLVEIIGELDVSNAGVDYFVNACLNLKEIRFKNNCIYNTVEFNCPLLSDESIQSIINGLADLTGSTAKTLTLNKDVKAKLTNDQIAQITSKNWTLA